VDVQYDKLATVVSRTKLTDGWLTFDLRPWPIYHIERPPLCTARCAWGSASRQQIFVSASVFALALVYSPVCISTSVCVFLRLQTTSSVGYRVHYVGQRRRSPTMATSVVEWNVTTSRTASRQAHVTSTTTSHYNWLVRRINCGHLRCWCLNTYVLSHRAFPAGRTHLTVLQPYRVRVDVSIIKRNLVH